MGNPNQASVLVLLLDIEGTVSPLAFVHGVMFPYARERLESFLSVEWNVPSVQAAAAQMASDAGHALADWHAVADEARRLMNADVKATGLKLLQGLIWEQGFKNAELRSTLFPDVHGALQAWRAAGKPARIYSSGSVHAQRLFFAHTEGGDLTPLLAGCYDTTIGPKREAESYRRIAADCGVAAESILFVSDVVAELNAAREAGMQTALAIRPGNAPPLVHDHLIITSLADIPLS